MEVSREVQKEQRVYCMHVYARASFQKERYVQGWILQGTVRVMKLE